MVNQQKYIEKLAQWTAIALPALTMWVPLGAEVWLLIVFFFMAAAWVTGWHPQSGIWHKEQKAIGLALLAMVSVKAASIMWSIAPALTWHHVKLHLHLLLFFPLLILFSQAKEVEKLFFTKALPLAIIPGVVWGVSEWAQKSYVLSGIDFEGATKNSLILSILFTFVVSNLFFELFRKISRRNIILLVLALFVIMLNGKRSSILIVFMVITFSWILQRHQDAKNAIVQRVGLPHSFLLIIIICGVAMVLIGFTWAKWKEAFHQAQIFFYYGYSGGSIDTRLQLYVLAWKSFLTNPWVGLGAGTTKAVVATSIYAQNLVHFNHYHQLVLQLLADLGVLGLLVWTGSLLTIQQALNTSTKNIYRLRLTAYTTILIMVLYGFANLSFGNILVHITFTYLLAIMSVNSDSSYSRPLT